MVVLRVSSGYFVEECLGRSARMGDEIGGHQVSGHVHTTAQVKQIEDTENNRRLTFQVSCGSAVASDLCVVYVPVASHHICADCLIADRVSEQFCCHSLCFETAHNGPCCRLHKVLAHAAGAQGMDEVHTCKRIYCCRWMQPHSESLRNVHAPL